MTAGLFELPGVVDGVGVSWRRGTLAEVNPLLRERHYLGPMHAGGAQLVVLGELGGWPVAAQVWRFPTSRMLPADGSWLELSRWCLTPEAGLNAGSRQHRLAVRELRACGVRTVVSYSDPSRGHTGALYRACNWLWAPTWHRLRPAPTGHGRWAVGERQQAVKDRWVFHVARHDPARAGLATDDLAAVRAWRHTAPPAEQRWAQLSGYVPEVAA